MHRPRSIVLAIIIALSTAALAACGSSSSSSSSSQKGSTGASAGGTYPVGASLALTGDFSVFDAPVLDGLKLGVQDVNAQGGLLGKYKMVLNVQDMRSDVSQAVVTVRSLLDKGVRLMLVACQTDADEASAPLAQKAQIPTFSTCATAPTLTTAVGNYMFGNYPADNFDSTATAGYAISQGYRTAFTIASTDSAFTTNVPKYFAKVFTDKGGKIVGTYNFSLSQTDFSALVTRIKAISPRPDVIETGMFEPAFPAFMKQLRAAGVTIPVIANSGIDTPSVRALGSVVNGVVYSIPSFPTPDNHLAALDARLAKRYGNSSVNTYAAVGYDLPLIIKAAVTKANSIDPTAVRNAIANLVNVQGVDGPITYKYPGSNGLPLRRFYLVRLENGKRILVKVVSLDPADVPKPF
jgi:branched-chain amino acid transport system substrate-binding protein